MTTILERTRPEERRFVTDPLCGAEADPVELMRVQGFRIVRCRRCGLAWSDPHLTDEALARLVYIEAYVADNWKRPRRRSLPSRLWRSLRALVVPVGHVEKRWACLRRWLPVGDPLDVLEVGCWTGDLLAHAAAHAPRWRLQGIDVSPFAVELAQQAGLNVHRAALETAGFADRSFDALVGWNVLEHCSDPLHFLRACRRVLRPGGRCILHLPNYGGLRATIAGPRWSDLLPEQHRWHFTHTALRRVLTATEAEILHLRSFWGNVGSQTLAVVRWS